jgi:hypothetical protein
MRQRRAQQLLSLPLIAVSQVRTHCSAALLSLTDLYGFQRHIANQALKFDIVESSVDWLA